MKGTRRRCVLCIGTHYTYHYHHWWIFATEYTLVIDQPSIHKYVASSYLFATLWSQELEQILEKVFHYHTIMRNLPNEKIKFTKESYVFLVWKLNWENMLYKIQNDNLKVWLMHLCAICIFSKYCKIENCWQQDQIKCSTYTFEKLKLEKFSSKCRLIKTLNSNAK